MFREQTAFRSHSHLRSDPPPLCRRVLGCTVIGVLKGKERQTQDPGAWRGEVPQITPSVCAPAASRMSDWHVNAVFVIILNAKKKFRYKFCAAGLRDSPQRIQFILRETQPRFLYSFIYILFVKKKKIKVCKEITKKTCNKLATAGTAHGTNLNTGETNFQGFSVFSWPQWK